MGVHHRLIRRRDAIVETVFASCRELVAHDRH
jgi:hypothetical protein